MKSTTLELKGRRYQYLLFGTGKKTIVMLHGLAADKGHMALLKQMFPNEPLFRKYRFLIPDLPGHNNLPVCGSGDVEDYAKYVICLLEHLKINDFALVGFSFGSLVSLKIAQRCKKRIPLVLWASPIAGISGMVRLGRPLLELMPATLYSGLINTPLAMGVGEILAPKRARRVLGSARKFDKSLLRHLQLAPDAEALALENPKLFIFGTNDPLIGEGAAGRLLKLKPRNSSILTLRRGGHAWTKQGVGDALRQIRLFISENL